MGEARERLFALEFIGIKLGLGQIRALLDALERPDGAYPSIIVAGTNGKGSVTAMTERALRAAGYRTGRYTSPHLVDLEERFAVDGVPVSSETLERLAARVLAAAEPLEAPPTFFEATTALALEAFRDAGVDVAILEVGLGGRLDATNAVAPIAAAITAIDFDHEQFLGSTLEAIATEKAGVIKPGMAVVLGGNPPVVEDVVRRRSEETGARLIRAMDGVAVHQTTAGGRTTITLSTPARVYDAVTLALRGRHQVQNAITAVRLLETVADLGAGFEIGAPAIREGLECADWPARLELVAGAHGEALIDGAHNPAGARALAAYILETYDRRLPFVVGVMQDKKIDAIVGALAPAASHFVCTAAETPRALEPGALAGVAARVAPDVPRTIAADPWSAFQAAAALGSPVVVAGSLYLAGALRSRLT
jgi:dihydrofolate synthase/folylpolyglutamate synthase